MHKQFLHTFGDSIYNLFGNYATFWSATQYNIDSDSAYDRFLHYNNANVGRNYVFKNAGFSVRCVRD